MLISRRNFFQISVLPAIASLAPGVSLFGQAADVPVRRTKTLEFKDFRDQIGTTFKLSDGIIARQAVLIEVKSSESSDANQSDKDIIDSKCFSLTFQLVTTLPSSQATYDVGHGKMGKFQLFLVPGELSPDQPLLIAIINRSR